MRTVVVTPRWLAAAVVLAAAAPAAAQIARSDIPTFPSSDWFDTGGDTSGDAAPKFDLTGLHAAYVDIDGEMTALFRFVTGETKNESTSNVALAGYLDTDGAANDPYVYETRFFTVRSEFFEGPQQGNSNDVVLVIQQWDDVTLTWQTTSFHSYTDPQDPSDYTGARPSAEAGGCGSNDASCAGWIFDSSYDLAPSHASTADRVGTTVLAMSMAELGITSPPLLLPKTFNATAPLSPQEAEVAHQIFDDGNPCNDPANPYYDPDTGTCGNHTTFAWMDSLSEEQAVATPVSVDVIERVPGGLRVSLVSVQGPTFLELWWQDDGGELKETGIELAVRDPGVHTLVEPADRGELDGRYVLVDRGVRHVFGVFAEDGARIDDEPHVRSRLRMERPRPTQASALTAGLRPGRGAARGIVPAVAGPLSFVDVGARGGVVRLPAVVGGRSVGGLWVDGERHVAFGCDVDVACVLVPPSDPARTPPMHRAALIDYGQARVVGRAPTGARGATATPALLVERRALPRKMDVSQWPYPLDQAWALTWVATPWVPTDSVVLDVAGAELVALELQASSMFTAADDEHALTIALDNVVLEDVRFHGPHAQLRLPLETSLGNEPATLSFSTVERESGDREFIALTGAVLELAVAPVVGDGFYALARRGGALTLDEDALVIVRRVNGTERAWHASAGQVVTVGEGEELAVVSLQHVAGDTVATYAAPTPADLVSADVVALVGVRGAELSQAALAIAPWRSTWESRGDEVVVAPFAAVAAALGASPEEGMERAVTLLASSPDGPRALVVVGSGTPVPDQELPQGSLHVPPPRRWHAGYTASSDVAPALDEAAAGGRLMPVSRVPVVSLAELHTASARLATMAHQSGFASVLVLADNADDFSAEAARIVAGSERASLDTTLVDAHVLGRAEALRQVRDGVVGGVGTLWYIGHGGFRGFGANLVYPTHLRSWANASAAPLTVVATTCFAGNVGGYGANRMPDLLFRWETPVRAALMGSGLLDVRTHDRVNAALTRAAIHNDELGAVWAAAMGQLLASGAAPEELAAYELLGDPFAPLR